MLCGASYLRIGMLTCFRARIPVEIDLESCWALYELAINRHNTTTLPTHTAPDAMQCRQMGRCYDISPAHARREEIDHAQCEPQSRSPQPVPPRSPPTRSCRPADYAFILRRLDLTVAGRTPVLSLAVLNMQPKLPGKPNAAEVLAPHNAETGRLIQLWDFRSGTRWARGASCVRPAGYRS